MTSFLEKRPADFPRAAKDSAPVNSIPPPLCARKRRRARSSAPVRDPLPTPPPRFALRAVGSRDAGPRRPRPSGAIPAGALWGGLCARPLHPARWKPKPEATGEALSMTLTYGCGLPPRRAGCPNTRPPAQVADRSGVLGGRAPAARARTMSACPAIGSPGSAPAVHPALRLRRASRRPRAPEDLPSPGLSGRNEALRARRLSSVPHAGRFFPPKARRRLPNPAAWVRRENGRLGQGPSRPWSTRQPPRPAPCTRSHRVMTTTLSLTAYLSRPAPKSSPSLGDDFILIECEAPRRRRGPPRTNAPSYWSRRWTAPGPLSEQLGLVPPRRRPPPPK
jgi:hypothetical protein